MLVLIDESGCCGFKLGKGSTSHFAISMVIFEDFKEAEKASKAIGDLRTKLGITPEFKFSKCQDTVRDEFFAILAPFDFCVRSMVVDKSKIYSQTLRTHRESFYNFFVKSLMKYDNDILNNANIKIDGCGDREFKQTLATYLRRELGGGKINKIKFVDSRQDNLIQLADMCVGAIMRSYKQDTRRNHDKWRKMIEGKIADTWDFK